ncbi:calcium-binding protein [Pseudovibrio ascidiaceicola]|uniref:calcium-binding protein n=1 Tax=Pseudovibrio ascidiaceicola TaxID=285279 RepID=UPI000D69A35B|nr:calcium-binding protein [Pseudovibrio ascidiaceicola]
MAADKMPQEGNNSYGFKRGIGKDYFGGAPGITTIRFDGDLTLSDFKIRLEAGDLVFYLIDPANPNQPLNEIADVFYFDNWIAGDHGIERFEFADGTSLSKIAVQSNGRLKLYGTAGDDAFIGTADRDEIYGSAGADTIDGKGGTDIVNYLLSDAGVTVNLATGEGSGGYAEGDQISNVESIIGSYHDDVLIGDDGNNNLFAQNGNDHLEGGAGDDWLNAYGSGADYLDGGSGNDTVRYRWSGSAVTVDLTDQANNAGDAAGDVYVSIENVMGSNSYDDHITGDAGDNKIWGYGGNDHLIGGDGNDHLMGGHGQDLLESGHGDDFLYGGDGNDTLATTGPGTKHLFGGQGNDSIYIFHGFSHINGGAGDDQLHYSGGDFNYEYALGDGNDIIDANGLAGPNNRLLLGEGILPDEVIFTQGGFDLDLTFKDGSTLTLQEGFFASSERMTFNEIEFSDGTIWTWEDINQKLTGETPSTETATTITLFYADDFYSTKSLHDHIIFAGAGNDTIITDKGDDQLHGEAGDDTLTGGEGNDTLTGGEGNDTLTGGLGFDYFIFGENFGKDIITDFVAGIASEDMILFADTFKSYEEIIAASHEQGLDTIIQLNDENSITLKNVSISDLHVHDFAFI